MRITNNILQREALSSMQSSLRKVGEAQRRATTGLKIQKASDDPGGSATSMRTRGSLRALEQYRRNVDAAGSRVAAEEGVLNQLSDVLIRAREIATSQGNATADTASRATAKAEVDELINFAVALGNTRMGDEYLFGGGGSNDAPFDLSQPDYISVDGAGNPIAPAGARRSEISASHFLYTSHDGQAVFVDSGALEALQDLSDALGADDAGDTRRSISGLKRSFDEVQSLLGEIGARTNQLEVTSANLDALEINLQTLKSNVEEVDLEVAVTELVTRQTAYQAAMLATSKVMGLTLADYLR